MRWGIVLIAFIGINFPSKVLGQIAIKWTMLKLFNPMTPSFYFNGELNPYKKSNKKTLQVSLGYGTWGNYSIQEVRPIKTRTGSLAIEHRYYFREKFTQRYISIAAEARNAFFTTENWRSICETGNCYQQLIEERSIRNAYNLVFRIGRMRDIGSNIHFDYYAGFGVKLAKKTGQMSELSEIDDYYRLGNGHYMFPLLSWGFRLGYMFKPKASISNF